MQEGLYAAKAPKWGLHVEKAREEVLSEAANDARGYFSRFKDGMGSQSAVMSLKEVVVVLIPTGEKLTIATLRVPLASVDAWFIGHYESKAASGGASFFVGIFDQPGN